MSHSRKHKILVHISVLAVINYKILAPSLCISIFFLGIWNLGIGIPNKPRTTDINNNNNRLQQSTTMTTDNQQDYTNDRSLYTETNRHHRPISHSFFVITSTIVPHRFPYNTIGISALPIPKPRLTTTDSDNQIRHHH